MTTITINDKEKPYLLHPVEDQDYADVDTTSWQEVFNTYDGTNGNLITGRGLIISVVFGALLTPGTIKYTTYDSDCELKFKLEVYDKTASSVFESHEVHKLAFWEENDVLNTWEAPDYFVPYFHVDYLSQKRLHAGHEFYLKGYLKFDSYYVPDVDDTATVVPMNDLRIVGMN